MTIDPAIGDRIRYVRELNHYSRDDLAESANMSSKFLYEIEVNNKGFSAISLLKICKALDVSSDYILTGENKTRCNDELVDIIESFDTIQIASLKKMLLIVLEMSKF